MYLAIDLLSGNRKYLYGSLVFTFITLICVTFSMLGSDDFDIARREILLRRVGHEILLQAGDSVSRVLPVKKIAENEYQISFEKAFTFQPAVLVDITQGLLAKDPLLSDYVVNVLNCSDGSVAYGYAMSKNTIDDIVACIGRKQPIGCYMINIKFKPRDVGRTGIGYFLGVVLLLTFVGFIFLRAGKERKILAEGKDNELRGEQHSELLESRHADFSGRQHSELSERRYTDLRGEQHSKLSESRYTDLPGNQHNELSESQHNELSESRHAGLPGSQFNELSENRHTALPDRQNNGMFTLGSMSFNAETRKLMINGETIELTRTESRVLGIFALSPNEIIERSRLQKEIWEDDGVIVGRSLDMFISKLRKKLELDPNINIVVIRGKGYRLEINV